MGPGPTVRRRRLGIELRRLREAAGLTLEEVGQQLEWSRSKVSRIETGHVAVRGRDVADLCQLYRLDAGHANELVALARGSKERGWWHSYVGLIGGPFQTYIGMEAEASRVRTYESEVVPGLLQTEGYAREITRATLVTGTEDQAQRMVELRMARQDRLKGEAPLSLWAVISEAVLRRVVGGPVVMREQLQRLVELGEQPHITVQVLPFSAGGHPAVNGPFVILQFPEPADPDVVYLENRNGSLYLEKAEETNDYDLVFNHLLAKAVDPDDSARLIRSAAEALA